MTIYRIYRAFTSDGHLREPWFFSSTGNTDSGRFDLPAPRGTCYFACSLLGSWLEVFRGVQVRDRQDVETRRIAHSLRKSSAIRLGDLASKKSINFKVTLDVASGDDYTQSQSWADDLEKHQFDGIRALLRHDPSGVEHTIGIFGPSGQSTTPANWQTTSTRIEDDALLLDSLRALGGHIVDAPYDIQATKPPIGKTTKKTSAKSARSRK